MSIQKLIREVQSLKKIANEEDLDNYYLVVSQMLDWDNIRETGRAIIASKKIRDITAFFEVDSKGDFKFYFEGEATGNLNDFGIVYEDQDEVAREVVGNTPLLWNLDRY